LARTGGAAGSAKALGVLLQDEGTRAKWLSKVKKDKTFDSIRQSPELQALVAPAMK